MHELLHQISDNQHFTIKFSLMGGKADRRKKANPRKTGPSGSKRNTQKRVTINSLGGQVNYTELK